MAKIYLSSTYSDLKEYREAVYRTLHQMGHSVIAMEDYVATDQRPLAKCVSDVAACEIYIGLFAWRYGYIPLEEGNPDRKSITELEYRTACQQEIPRLVFLLDEDVAWSPKKQDTHTGDAEQGLLIKALRQELGKDNLASFFKSPDELAKLVSVAVGNLRKGQAAPAKRLVPFMAERLPEYFVPRPAEFEELVEHLCQPAGAGAVALTAALRGAGGYGKTTLARALCHEPRVRESFPDGVLWATLGETPGELTKHITPLVYALSHERPLFTKVEEATHHLAELLGDRKLLIVIDDVWNAAHLHPFLQGGPNCARLITTRDAATVPAAAQKVRVDAMQVSEAVDLLGAGLAVGSPAFSRKGSEVTSLPPEGGTTNAWPTNAWPTHVWADAATQTALEALAKRLGEWPLLLRLVNGALRQRVENDQQPLAEALVWVNRALDKRGLTFFDEKNPEARNQAVAQTLGVSLDLLSGEQRARFAELAIFPEDAEIPLATLQKL